MLSKPKAGWTDVEIGDFRASASYLTDIPFDWLRSCITGLKYVIPASCFLDEEGSTALIVSDISSTYVIRNGSELTELRGIGLREFSEMLIADIREHFEDWVWWCDIQFTDVQYARRTALLRGLIEEAEWALENYMRGSGNNW